MTNGLNQRNLYTRPYYIYHSYLTTNEQTNEQVETYKRKSIETVF